jgi:hypothetical protein
MKIIHLSRTLSYLLSQEKTEGILICQIKLSEVTNSSSF